MSLQELAQSRQERLQKLKRKINVDETSEVTTQQNVNETVTKEDVAVEDVTGEDVTGEDEASEVEASEDVSSVDQYQALLQPQLDILKKRTDESIKRLVRRRIMEEYSD